MIAYCVFIFIITNEKVQERLFVYITFTVQIISFLTAFFTLVLIAIRLSIYWIISENKAIFADYLTIEYGA